MSAFRFELDSASHCTWCTRNSCIDLLCTSVGDMIDPRLGFLAVSTLPLRIDERVASKLVAVAVCTLFDVAVCATIGLWFSLRYTIGLEEEFR